MPTEPTLQSLAMDLGLGVRDATEIYNFLYEREQMLRMVQAELETHKSNAPTAWLALKDRIQSSVNLAAPVRSETRPQGRREEDEAEAARGVRE